MGIENLMDELEDIIEASWHLPMSGGRTVVDSNEVRRILEDIRLQLPKEIIQARKIVEEHDRILENARQEVDTMMKVSEEKIKAMVNKSEIVKSAQASANNIISEAASQSKEIRRSAQEYADDVMKHLDEIVSSNLSEIRKARKMLNSSEKKLKNFKKVLDIQK